MSSIHDLTVFELTRALKTKTLGAVEVAEHFLDRVEHEKLGSFLSHNRDTTIKSARASQVKLNSNKAGQLEGLPIGHKDVFVTKDFPSTAGSKMLESYMSSFDATVVAKLANAGCVTVGKLNCDEFAMGSSNENSAYGPVLNPWDNAKVPGGSSGGSAAAVSARLIPAATGTDTGGSIRQPASFCGITGIKPTYGRISRYGMIAYASSLDQAGPMAKDAQDCALLLSAMCSGDPDRDSTSLDIPAEDYTTHLNDSLKGVKIGLPIEFFGEGLDTGVRKAIELAIDVFKDLGAEIVSVSLPKTQLSIPVYYIIAPAEASSNLSRFDGVRYGYRAKEYTDLIDMYKKSRSQGLGEEVKKRIMTGAYVLSHGYYDAYYLKAQKIRRLIAEDFSAAYKKCDIILGPVAPTVAWGLNEKIADPISSYLADIFTLPASLAGLPAMSVPCGMSDAVKPLPIGMQLIGNYLQESKLLNVAHMFQTLTHWHTLSPTQAKTDSPL